MGSRGEHGSCPCALGRRKYKLGCEEGRGRKLLSRAETPPGRTAWLSEHFHPPPFTGPPGLEGLSTLPPSVGPTGQTPVRPGDAAPVWEPRCGLTAPTPTGRSTPQNAGRTLPCLLVPLPIRQDHDLPSSNPGEGYGAWRSCLPENVLGHH